ncbi:STAS domain-containing protein [uncultured Thiocystis sp.]|jgi:anti-anti-sigma factor|uniref:STAS domain-containing protein n=1 Tax=uncultured Thiocystis sp. TaxID=1202134 RepID=UPI0025DB13F0|nr:STAS domain-containing protein [uncultured Thiocystis sp.]
MSVTYRIDEQTSQVTIAIGGRFDYSVHQEFLNAFRNIDSKTMTYFVDLSNTSYLDSSALGMLLILREHAGTGVAPVTISGYGENVGKILKIANFDKLFTFKP